VVFELTVDKIDGMVISGNAAYDMSGNLIKKKVIGLSSLSHDGMMSQVEMNRLGTPVTS